MSCRKEKIESRPLARIGGKKFLFSCGTLGASENDVSFGLFSESRKKKLLIDMMILLFFFFYLAFSGGKKKDLVGKG